MPGSDSFFHIFRFFSVFFLLFLCPLPAHAQFDEQLLEDPFAPSISPEVSQEYILEIEQIPVASSPAQLTPPPRSSFTPEEQQEFETQGYILRTANRWYDDRIAFTLSDSNLSFPDLTSGTSHQEKTILSTSTSGKAGFQLLSEQLSPFQTPAGHEIHPTVCDDSKTTCQPHRAGTWTRTQIYGLGYTLSGNPIPSDFIDDRYYRPFSSEQIVLLYAPTRPEKQSAQMTVKVQIPDDQPQGNYVTTVKMLVIPYP